MSLYQCSSDRELAQRRNTHKFSRLRSRCQEPSNSEAAWLKAREIQNIHKATSSHICTSRSCLSQAGSTAPWLGSAGRSREQAARREKPDAFFRTGKMHLPVAFFYRRLNWVLSVSRNRRLYAIFIKESHRNTRKFSKIKRVFWPFPTSPQHRDTCPNAF